MLALREFASSFLFIVSCLIFAISAFLLYWAVIMPILAIIPFLISLVTEIYYVFTVQENLILKKINNTLMNGYASLTIRA
ncbi:hypothetical protein [Metabacillus endolithicus]|uniref:hypothetical protein n=1 Tax=Metabacillus endolithicus TaxID=1535204 RepID=UPI001FF95A8E|nr:hypothetical protein [Metabacillus endolithicus]UPG63850.1 hypothetical protein MVE64_01420 [Metabacillus endolithicus]